MMENLRRCLYAISWANVVKEAVPDVHLWQLDILFLAMEAHDRGEKFHLHIQSGGRVNGRTALNRFLYGVNDGAWDGLGVPKNERPSR